MTTPDFRALVEGKKIAVTGKFEDIKRQILECLVEWCGGTLAKSVGKTTNIVIAAKDISPANAQKCKDLGIPLVSEKEALDLLCETTISIPDTVAEIGERAFSSCRGIKRIILPNTVTKIGSMAFYHCADLEYISIPASVEEIGDHVFYECGNLSTIDLDSANTNFQIADGVVIKDGEALFTAPKNPLDTVSLPNTVTRIKNGCFSGSHLKHIVLPDSLVEINYCAFSYCEDLEELVLPGSVQTIEYGAFMCTSSLREISIPEGVTSIDERTFFSCTQLEKVVLPKSLNKLSTLAFLDCKNLKEITIPASIENLEEFGFPEGVKINRI
ncbi:MAG: leucine-rich repeat protein [Paludibacteraceae bacterium]|nr:leucine-rich repeat protein [Paludibacteraceae bacterium]MBR6105447.1 leucine-rich repeat protein [Paludibacteraceae bacterium]MCR5568806.1 leucine-rich repeat protein [Paludibacteraceae bacterium]